MNRHNDFPAELAIPISWALLISSASRPGAVAVAFAKFLGVVWPAGWRPISLDEYLVEPFPVVGSYYLSLSTAQLVGVILIGVLTVTNVFGLKYGKWIQNVSVAVVESFIFSPLVFVVDGAEILWTTHIESGIAKQITQMIG